jgi:predicted nucleotidyltransferase
VVGLVNNHIGTLKEIEELAKRIVPILRDGGVVEASVFGSFARGEVQPDSDLDLLVKYGETVSLFDVSGLKYELEKLIGSKVDLISKDYLKPRLKKRILQESIRIL